jgi:hypothetical protein
MITVSIGVDSDYFIAVGMNCLSHRGFPKRTFFWCSPKNWKFSQLPEPNTKMGAIFDQI